MSATTRAIRVGLFGLLLFALAACQPVYRNHGWAPSDRDLAGITVGKDTRDTVVTTIGAPGTSGLLEDSAWYYVQSRWVHYAWRAPKEIDREVVAISFDNGGRVSNIERFGLADGQVVALSRRVTASNIKGITFLQQLFGSLGRLNAGQLLGPN